MEMNLSVELKFGFGSRSEKEDGKFVGCCAKEISPTFLFFRLYGGEALSSKSSARVAFFRSFFEAKNENGLGWGSEF